MSAAARRLEIRRGAWVASDELRSARDGVGKRDTVVHIAGIAVAPGDWLYADADGVLVARQKIA